MKALLLEVSTSEPCFCKKKGLDRKVFIDPTRDVKNKSNIWKRKKPLYGLNDDSKKFWMNVREVFDETGQMKQKGMKLTTIATIREKTWKV